MFSCIVKKIFTNGAVIVAYTRKCWKLNVPQEVALRWIQWNGDKVLWRQLLTMTEFDVTISLPVMHCSLDIQTSVCYWTFPTPNRRTAEAELLVHQIKLASLDNHNECDGGVRLVMVMMMSLPFRMLWLREAVVGGWLNEVYAISNYITN